MLAIYNLGLKLYFLAVYIASFFNKKASLWLNGRKDQYVSSINGLAFLDSIKYN